MNNYLIKIKNDHLHNDNFCKQNCAKGRNTCIVEKGKVLDTNSSIIWQNFSSTYHHILKASIQIQKFLEDTTIVTKDGTKSISGSELGLRIAET